MEKTAKVGKIMSSSTDKIFCFLISGFCMDGCAAMLNSCVTSRRTGPHQLTAATADWGSTADLAAGQTS